jgi:CDGSH-type Zn-finger protein
MADVTIRLRDNGPLVVEGPVTIVDAEGNKFHIDANKPAVALCRCGQSSRRPFCDGTHKACGFQAADRATPPPPPVQLT